MTKGIKRHTGENSYRESGKETSNYFIGIKKKKGQGEYCTGTRLGKGCSGRTKCMRLFNSCCFSSLWRKQEEKRL